MVCEICPGLKFHSSDQLRRVKMRVGQVEYLQDLSDGRLHISDFHISCIFQTSEWYIWTSDFYNPFARRSKPVCNGQSSLHVNL